MLGALAPVIGQAEGGGSATGLLVPLVLMVAVFYFLLIRPQQKRQRQQRELLSSIDVGDEVLTIGGMFGVVRAIDEDEVTLQVGDGMEVRFLKSAIARKVVQDELEQGPAEQEDEAGEGK